ncbi:Transcriptional regulator, LacI family [Azotobacter vinelandii CA]|uniref:Transcriptional regulator, LacI family n=2 Tax=Azotobacter vinelandii TaxID=354 RepID=C1DKQ2_AZOVD|nr:LacI family DNA-binding transcriptional regulator [Azotobacter vinelandii]ACO78904.1 Transcriptional regulator, LacI family [Azotobacter vinelandii DJ]AGK16561.1 Transcriptional regulator, LacI family [Azotobacter vinelandii CA]AGK20842.1 Transcriptional regulator, LacI family [Azotobacter vinelandii CA6]SFY31592.1 transcriptional regulator, LacI family [Azotobacter vinelandii]GLK61101.1 GntR family transcriptional regulator [Azotobacter vinelandii]
MTTPKNDKNPRTTGRPTLNEVARRAGVSPITASRALRGIPSVAEELAQRVREAASELGYVANPAARALASARSQTVAVVVPSLGNQLFVETLEAIHAVMRPRGLEVLIGNSHYSRDEEEDLIRNYLAYQPRGLLLTGFERTESARRMLESSGIPCVYMMDLDSGAGLHCVGFSQIRAGAAAAEHLISRGRRRMAFVGAQLDQRTLLRGEGFRRALQQAGLYDPALELLTPRPSSVGLGCELFAQLMASHPQIDAIFFGNDDLAHGALLEAMRRGVKIPEQVAVIGFNDLPASSFTVPRLSSIRTPREAIGRRAAELLLALMAGQPIAEPVQDIGFELMAREST